MNATIQPLHQPIADAIRNAAQVATNWAQVSEGDAAKAFERIAQLLRGALDQLGEPSYHTQNVTQMFLDMLPVPPGADYDRFVRDAAGAILHAQVTGTIVARFPNVQRFVSVVGAAEVFEDPTPGTTFCPICHRPMMSHRMIGETPVCPDAAEWDVNLPRWEPK